MFLHMLISPGFAREIFEEHGISVLLHIDFLGFQPHVLPVLFGLPEEAMPFCTAGLARGTLLGEDMPPILRVTCGHRNPPAKPVWSPRLCQGVLAFSVCLAEQLSRFCKGNAG